MTLRTLNYGNYGIFLIMGNAGFCPSTVYIYICIYIYISYTPVTYDLGNWSPRDPQHDDRKF